MPVGFVPKLMLEPMQNTNRVKNDRMMGSPLPRAQNVGNPQRMASIIATQLASRKSDCASVISAASRLILRIIFIQMSTQELRTLDIVDPRYPVRLHESFADVPVEFE